MLPTLALGPLSIPVAPLLVLAGIWFGLLAAERSAARLSLATSDIDSLVIIALLSGLVGARAAYVLRYPQAFLASPLSLLSRETGLLDPLAGLLVAMLAMAAYLQRRRLPAWRTLDALAPGFALFAVFLGFAHLADGSAFGMPTSQPWGIWLWGERRQPTQVYEILLALLILGVIWRSGRLLSARLPGLAFLAFLAMSAAARLFLEAFRGDSALLPGGLRLPQVIAWLVLAACLALIYRLLLPQSAPE